VKDFQGGVMSKEEGFKRFLSNPGGFTEYYGVSSSGGEEVVKKGTPPKVKVGIKNVGKRQVTLITGKRPSLPFSLIKVKTVLLIPL